MLAYAILALLRDGADHGYRLKRRLDQLLGPVWRVNIGQVYQVLDRLRREGWAEELPPEAERDGGHERWPVAITEAGRRELERWLTEPIRPTRPRGPARNEILSRLAIGGRESAYDVAEGALVERAIYAREHDEVIVRSREFASPDDAIDSAKFLALEATRLALRAHVEWLDVCIEHLCAMGCTSRSQENRSGSGSSTARAGSARNLGSG